MIKRQNWAVSYGGGEYGSEDSSDSELEEAEKDALPDEFAQLQSLLDDDPEPEAEPEVEAEPDAVEEAVEGQLVMVTCPEGLSAVRRCRC